MGSGPPNDYIPPLELARRLYALANGKDPDW
jgi:hypothetical protein